MVNSEIDFEQPAEEDYSNITPIQEEDKEQREIGIIKELSSKKVLEDMRMELKGFNYDYETKEWKKVNEPLMNEKGINKFLWIMRGAGVSDLITFSNFNDKQITKQVRHICSQCIPVVHINYKEYGISKSDLPIISNLIFTWSLAAFNKALGAGDRSVINKTISENIVSRSMMGTGGMQQPTRKSFMEKINPFK